jgi:hypothetical protein
MMIDHLLRFTLPAAYSLLPEAMRSDRATAMLLAIGLHESDGFRARRQYNRGPAHGFWQFERVGTRGVLEHPRTQAAAAAVIDALCYRLPKATPARQALEVFDAITHNDTLACCLARLLLWTIPHPLPTATEPYIAFQQYLDAWRPGAFARGSEDQRAQLRAIWTHHYAEAWGRVQAAS